MRAEPLAPAGAGDREPVLDAVRGFAVLGILLVNIDLMRGADVFRALGGLAPRTTGELDAVVGFMVGWLVSGKFLSSFAIMFGVGAAIIAMRSSGAGRAPPVLLLRRYGLLAVFGLAHMVLLFPGDILFVYALAAIVLLPFVGLRARTAVRLAVGIVAMLLALGFALAALGAFEFGQPAGPALAEDMAAHSEQAVAAHREGTYADVVVANARAALVVQASAAIVLPWIVALFLLGYAIGRSGMLADLLAHRRQLRVAAVAGLALGLPLNVAVGLVGPVPGVGEAAQATSTWLELLGLAGQIVGAPLLAIGYLAALSLVFLRLGSPRRLAATGRMALTAYLLQSAIALAVFAGAGLYDRLTYGQSLLVVLGIWVVLLTVCPLWMRRFRFGPAEWLWRSLTYGRRQPFRIG